MFHAFITKANKAHQTFTELLESFQEEEDGQKADDEAGTMDMDAAENIDDSDEYVIEEDIKRESNDNDLSESASLIRTLTDTQGDSSGSVDETAGEYDQENQENNGKYKKVVEKKRNVPAYNETFLISICQYYSHCRRLQCRVFGP